MKNKCNGSREKLTFVINRMDHGKVSFYGNVHQVVN